MRRHREEMEVAVAHGLSLEAARERLQSYRRHLPRLAAPIGDVGGLGAAAQAERPVLWWQREDL